MNSKADAGLAFEPLVRLDDRPVMQTIAVDIGNESWRTEAVIGSDGCPFEEHVLLWTT